MPLLRLHQLLHLLAACALLSSAAWADEAARVAASEQVTDAPSQDPPGSMAVEEIRALLECIVPYLPQQEVAGEIDVFGSTTMDSLAHGWAQGFKKFHPEAEIVISAEGSETVFDRLLKNPGSIGMLSRPVTQNDLQRLKDEGLKQPVAIQVARDGLGVFVHKDNPLQEISYPQLVALFCAEDPESSVNWGVVGVEGDFANQPVQIIGRTKSSGTRNFIEKFLFHSNRMRNDHKYLECNYEVIKAVSENKNAIAIVDFSCGSEAVKRLHLRDKSMVIEDSEHEILLGRYPIMRPMVLVMDAAQTGETAVANREFVRYALAQAGQTQAILSGFYPFDPPTLRAELEKLEAAKPPQPANTALKQEDRR